MLLDKPDPFAAFQGQQDRTTVQMPLSKTALDGLQWLVTRTGSADIPELLERLGRSTHNEEGVRQLREDLVVQPLLRQGLLLSPSQFRSFLDHAPLGIAVAQCSNHCFVLVNRTFCSMLGYSEAELLALNCYAISHPEDLPAEQSLAEALIAGDTDSYQLDKRFVRADGSCFWAHLTAAGVRDSAGQLLYILAMVLDITERRRHQDLLASQMAELERLHLLKDDFLSTVSHELRTPLTNMRLALHMLEQPGPDQRQTVYMELLKRECEREVELVNNLLDLQRCEASVVEPEWCKLNLPQCLAGLLAGFTSRFEAQGQRLGVEIPADLPLLRTDRAWLERIVAELLTNACKYAPPGARIVVGLSRGEGKVLLTVGNDGPPIPAEALPHLFEKFYRVAGGDARGKGGTGLGLALVRSLLERMGGTIAVCSAGNWTEFTVALPTVD